MSPFTIERLDHLVLTVRDIDATVVFYSRVLGFQPVSFGNNRMALVFGRQKINLHPAAAPIQPHAANPTSGAADLCLITESPIAEVVAHLKTLGIPIEEGPVPRSGAMGAITSVYIRDPDANLLEIAHYE